LSAALFGFKGQIRGSETSETISESFKNGYQFWVLSS
jgi:hypothetical protein